MSKLRRTRRGNVAETRARGQFGKSIALRSFGRTSDMLIVVIGDTEPGSIWLTRRGLMKFRADIDRHLKDRP